MSRRAPKCPIIRAVCPRNSDPANGPYCPHWWEFEARDDATGQAELKRMCGHTALPQFLHSIATAASQSSGEVNALRGEIHDGTKRIAVGVVNQLLNARLEGR